ncbi:hypothetical protein, partial [Actinomadura sp. J1-007]|uniref:hypothetical protein n=1 Tax=Actinomadura sp. J1-007 TaxID=2661913 RepID=UPI0035CCD0A9
EAVRRCTVPAGRTLVAPLVNQVGDSEAACVRFLSGATGRMTVDGPRGRCCGGAAFRCGRRVCRAIR